VIGACARHAGVGEGLQPEQPTGQHGQASTALAGQHARGNQAQWLSAVSSLDDGNGGEVVELAAFQCERSEEP
jgi:hypothetical protein